MHKNTISIFKPYQKSYVWVGNNKQVLLTYQRGWTQHIKFHFYVLKLCLTLLYKPKSMNEFGIETRYTVTSPHFLKTSNDYVFRFKVKSMINYIKIQCKVLGSTLGVALISCTMFSPIAMKAFSHSIRFLNQTRCKNYIIMHMPNLNSEGLRINCLWYSNNILLLILWESLASGQNSINLIKK